jgi:hypothetical protein
MLVDLIKDLQPRAFAAPGIYKTLNYQGKLQDLDGITVPDAAYNIKFTIYDAAAAGNVLWTARESDACGAPFNPAAKSVTTSVGVFSTMLGESGDCPLNLDFNSDNYYLGITVGSDAEMTPRKRIGAAGYAFNADLLDGLSTSAVGGASAFVPATGASGNLVLTGNVTFDTNTFALDSTNDNIGIGTATPDITRTLDLTTTKKYGVYATTSFGTNDAAAVYGEATSVINARKAGGEFSGAGPGGRGVIGNATATGNPGVSNYGGYFSSAGDAGYGVYAEATAGAGASNFGGFFTAAGDGFGASGVFGQASGAGNVYGVQGLANGTGAITNYGGNFQASGDTGYGVRGAAVASGAVANYGGYFEANGNSGVGVSGVGIATGAGVTNYGGYFTAGGDTAIAVYGAAQDTGASVNYGGQFYAYGDNGRGVYGQAAAAGAFINYGGVFEALGDLGVGVSGTASATGAVTNYGGYFTAAGAGWEATGVYGVASGANTVRGVYGGALSTAAVANYGGLFQAQGEAGRGVYGEANNSTGSNYGGYFTAAGTGFGTTGVYGQGSATGAVTNYGGYFLAQGETGAGVKGEANSTAAAVNYGGIFMAAGTASGTKGVYGEASGTGAIANYGGYFTTAGQSGQAVYGAATATGAVTNYGGYFTAAGDTGTAVFGSATAVAGASAIGGRFEAGGDGGAYGVQAVSTAATGNNYGIYASVISATGWAGYFNGGKGIYADRFSINDAVSAVAYNTIGTAAASHTAAGEITDNSDLFIASSLEVDGAAWFDGGYTDLAEMVAYSGEGEAGDVVVIDENNDNAAKLATKPYDQSVLGVLSTKPSLIITGDIKEGKLMAVAGRVLTKVTNVNGAIHRGDLLTTSSVPGHAMKATEPGSIVGKALGECDENDCTIWVFLNVSWYGGVRTEVVTTVSPTAEDAEDLDRDSILDKVTDFWKKVVSWIKK